MKKYAFILDSGSSFDLKQNENTFIIPIQINVEQNNDVKFYEDNVNIDRQKIYDIIDNKIKIFTSQPNINVVKEMLINLFKEFEYIFFIPLSKHLSNFYNNLKNLNKDFKNLILIDSESIGIDGNWIVDELEQYLKSDNPINALAIKKHFEERKKNICGAVIVTDFNQLLNGGRISKTKAFLAKLVKVKISVKFDGKLEFYSKDFSIEAAISKVLKMIDNEINYTKYGIEKLSIMNDLKDHEFGEKLKLMICKKLNFNNNESSLLPGCIVTHVGTNTFSILIKNNKKVPW